jgi:small subunit ribosomal protein S6
VRFYENVFVARQDITSTQVEGLAQQYAAIIEQFGGKVTKTELCGLRNLAYPIKKNKKGHYVLMNVAVKSEGMKEVERHMSLNENILRYLTIKVDVLDNNPSPLMQQKGFRDDQARYNDDYDDDLLA